MQDNKKINFSYKINEESKNMCEIGEAIREWRREKGINLEDAAKIVYDSTDEERRGAIATLISYLGFIEQGNLYSKASLIARKGKQGEINLARLSLYLHSLNIPENHDIIKRIKEFDKRLSYPLKKPSVS